MQLDGRSLPRGSTLVRDVCVVGAGAAGIALARELAARGVEVILLESGGFELESETQALYAGASRGEILDRNRARYLEASRLRFFGGSTNHWSGYCRPLDPVDFEERPWVKPSGWPFRRGHLDPYYARAARVVEVPPFEPGASATPTDPTVFPTGSGVEIARFHMSPPTRFGRTYRAELLGSPEVRLVTHANVLALETDGDGGRVVRARVGTLDGNRFDVAARAFVLATGGIENARLLLLSDSRHPSGLGNQHDLVGRCFMDHPHVLAGWVVLPEPPAGFARLLHRPEETYFGLRFTDEEQRRHRLLNATFWFYAEKLHRNQTPALRAEVGALAEHGGRSEAAGATGPAPAADLGAAFKIVCEQAPDPASRVSLGDDRDELGLRRVRLDWRVGRQDLQSLLASCEQLGLAFGRYGLGRVSFKQKARGLWSSASGGAHHMGTTRMHVDPRQGVVDEHARVHGVANLWIAGSSVFPTSGSSNPTLTLVALALRLADRLHAELPTLA
jgi:choline dehydrogenase-like flavoprotein